MSNNFNNVDTGAPVETLQELATGRTWEELQTEQAQQQSDVAACQSLARLLQSNPSLMAQFLNDPSIVAAYAEEQ